MCQVPDCQYQFSINDYIRHHTTSKFHGIFLTKFSVEKVVLTNV